MAALMRKCYGVLLGKTCYFSDRARTLGFTRLSAKCTHTSCTVMEDFGGNQNVYENKMDTDCRDFDVGKMDVCLSKLSLAEEELNQYPVRRFSGNIYVIKGPLHEHDSEIIQVLDKLKQERVLGLDSEMTELPRGASQHGSKKRLKKTRVVQIASQTDAVVWQLKHFKRLPLSLESFLTSDRILKVGHAISDDVVLLKKEFNIRSTCLFDTLPWAMELNCKPLALNGLCAIFLGWRISKGLRTSDWNRSELSENQIYYACTDAWASLLLYNKMKSVTKSNSKQCPAVISSVNDILNARLLTKRRRRHRLIRNNKARKNLVLLRETASQLVE